MANTFAPPSPPVIAAKLEYSGASVPVIPSPIQQFGPIQPPAPGNVTFSAVPL